ncbi:hypothetical protein [Terriglobus albidus]|uniref:hypothetical protein n=1 Tax=Terriglobus albidus TaxID=1592106 RepID=UPI0021E0D725|nr:hypothetical protein [Terriglobus albidus]
MTGSLIHAPGSQGETQSKIEVWADGGGGYRSEVRSGGEARLTLASNGRGLKKNSSTDKSTKVSPQTAQSAQQWIAPWLLLEGQLSNHRCVQAKSEGAASLGLLGYRFEPDTSQEKTRPLYDTTFTLWIKSSSGLPDHIEFFLPASDNPSAGSRLHGTALPAAATTPNRSM